MNTISIFKLILYKMHDIIIDERFKKPCKNKHKYSRKEINYVEEH